ncbi:MAG: hypothetical protein AAGE80_05495 [Pseudomonadota bacterium]
MNIDPMVALARAYVIRQKVQYASDDSVTGKQAMALRKDAAEGRMDHLEEYGIALNKLAGPTIQKLSEIGVHDMPANSDQISMLVEWVSQRKGGISISAVWEMIGVKASTGRGYTSGRSEISWPVWFTLRALALEE